MFRTSLLMLAALVSCCQDIKFAYPIPDASQFSVAKDVHYATWTGGDLLMDVYTPADTPSNARLPVVVFLNTFGFSRRAEEMYTGWAKVAAAHGFAAINPDSRPDGIEQDFDLMTAYLTEHAAELRIDANQIAVHAVSGNVFAALPLVENPRRTAVKAAVMYYGLGPVHDLRMDLPVLLVRAGLDRPPLNRQFGDFVASAMTHNVPITLLNYSGGHHGFDVIDNNGATREVVEQTFAFLKSALSREYQAGLRVGIPQASAAAAVMGGDFARAVTLYAPLVAANPQDRSLALSYGESLLGAARYKDARALFDRLKIQGGLGLRDLGVPASRACALDGDSEAAMAWLQTIPKQFLPKELKDDAAFQNLRGRADFQALFQ